MFSFRVHFHCSYAESAFGTSRCLDRADTELRDASERLLSVGQQLQSMCDVVVGQKKTRQGSKGVAATSGSLLLQDREEHGGRGTFYYTRESLQLRVTAPELPNIRAIAYNSIHHKLRLWHPETAVHLSAFMICSFITRTRRHWYCTSTKCRVEKLNRNHVSDVPVDQAKLQVAKSMIYNFFFLVSKSIPTFV